MTNPEPPTSTERLMAAALAAFNEFGINAASINKICERAQVSIGSAYHHFGSKQGLADALLVEGLRRNAAALRARLERESGAEAGIRAIVESLIDWIEANPEWARFIYTAADARPRASTVATRNPLDAVNADYREMIINYFAPYLRAGQLRRLPTDVYASLVLGPTHDYARKTLSGQTEASLSDVRQLFADEAWRVVRGKDAEPHDSA